MGLPAEQTDNGFAALASGDAAGKAIDPRGASEKLEEGAVHVSNQIRNHLFIGLFFALNVVIFHLLLRFEVFPESELDLPLLFSLISGTFGLILGLFCLHHLWPKVQREVRDARVGEGILSSLTLVGVAAAAIFAALSDFDSLVEVALPQSLVLTALIVNLWVYLERLFADRCRAAVRPFSVPREHRYSRMVVASAAATEAGTDSEPVTADLLREGDIVKLSAGDLIPADGVILTGTCEVEERRYGGRAVAHVRSPGQEVLAGSLVLRGDIRYRIELCPIDSRVTYFEEGFQSASKETPGDESESVFPRVALSSAALLFIGACAAVYWHDRTGFGATVFLVPAAVFAIGMLFSVLRHERTLLLLALRSVFARGALCRGMRALRNLSRTESLIIDYQPQMGSGARVTAFELIDGRVSEEQLYPVLFALFGNFHETAGIEIAQYLRRRIREPKLYEVADFHAYPGRGVFGTVQGAELTAGTEEFLIERGVVFQASEVEDEPAGAEKYWYVAIGPDPVARIRIAACSAPIGPSELAEIRGMGVRVQLASTEVSAEELDRIGKQAGFELAEISGGLSSEQLRLKVENAKSALLVAHRDTPKETRSSATLVAEFFDELRYELDRADVILLDPHPRLLVDVLRIGRLYWSIVRSSLALGGILTLSLLVLSITSVASPVVVALAALVGWTALALNYLRLLPTRSTQLERV